MALNPNSERDSIRNRKAQMMSSIVSSPGMSLFQLAINSGLPYVTAHRYMKRLEMDGSILVIRSGPGSQLLINPSEGRAADNVTADYVGR